MATAQAGIHDRRSRGTAYLMPASGRNPNLKNMTILKEEINQLSADTLSLAKWKIVTVSAFAAFGLGWSKESSPDPHSAVLLLYSVGFLCAYIDSIYYRRTTTVHSIAAYLRTYGGTDAETLELKA